MDYDILPSTSISPEMQKRAEETSQEYVKRIDAANQLVRSQSSQGTQNQGPVQSAYEDELNKQQQAGYGR